MSKTTWVVIAIVGVIAAILGALSLGGGDDVSGGATGDAGGDVVVSEGSKPPENISVADISSATVRREGGRVIFEATMADDLPSDLDEGSLEFRWDVSEEGRDTWIVSASVNIDMTAAVTSQKTDYGSSTIDGSMPGKVEADGDVLRVEIRADKIDGFPESFTWRLMTTLDGSRSETGSATASDTAPDDGTRELAP